MLLGRLRALSLFGTLALLLGPVHDAAALSIALAGPTSGPLTGGIGSEVSSSGEQIAFSIGLDAVTEVNGYDVTLAWDAAELSLFSASAWSELPFSSAPDGGESGGSRVASITLSPASTDLLFTVVFDVLAPMGDGQADVSVFIDAATNGSGLAPGSLSLANPGGAGIDVIPEPTTAALVAFGLGLLGAAGRVRARREDADDDAL